MSKPIPEWPPGRRDAPPEVLAAINERYAAKRRGDTLRTRYSYAVGALIVVVNIVGAVLGVFDWAVAVPSLSLAAVLIKAGVDHGRLW